MYIRRLRLNRLHCNICTHATVLWALKARPDNAGVKQPPHPPARPPAVAPLIRALTVQDLPAYKALRDEALRVAPDAFTSDYATEVLRSADSYASRLGDVTSGHFVLGAFDDAGALLGSIALEREGRLHKRHCAHVTAMMVAQRAQDQGIATQLIAACARFAWASGHLEQLTLTVTASNTQVVRLYERAGFVAYGLLPRAVKMGDQYFDKLHMRLEAVPPDLTAAHHALSPMSHNAL